MKKIKNQNNIQETIIDGAICAVTLGLSNNYPELAPIIEVVSAASNILSFAYVRNILIELSTRFEKMRSENIQMEYLHSPQFVMDIKQLLYEQSLEDLEQKKLLYANYFESRCRCSDVEKLNSQKYFYLLRELDILEFAMLKKLSPTIRTPQCVKNIHQSCVKNFDGLTIEDIHMRLESLISKGITEKISSKEFMNMDHFRTRGNIAPRKEENYYYRTTLGNKFLQFINIKS